LYLTAAGSLGAFVLYTFLVNRWGIARSTLLGVTVPIVALIVGTTVGGEGLDATTLVGGVIALAGVAVAIKR
jgi:drug/metabolite transporter (DMT)-like permease